jgi:hypothetical protein
MAQSTVAGAKLAELDVNLHLYRGTLTRQYLLEMALKLSQPDGEKAKVNTTKAAKIWQEKCEEVHT